MSIKIGDNLNFARYISDIVITYGKKLKAFFSSDNCVRNINIDYTKKQKRVLCCYLDFQQSTQIMSKGSTHSNQPRLFQIIQCFIKMDMIIDLCGCNDIIALKHINFEEYDYIFGFGKVFEAACKSKSTAYKIIYMTEDPYFIAKKREDERLAYFLSRHTNTNEKRIMRNFSNIRAGQFYLPGQEEDADAIICQGEETHFKKLNKPIYHIVPNAFKNEKFSNQQNKREITNFVVFGVAGYIRKGIDLLVEVFAKHPNWKLYLCGHRITKGLKKLGYSVLPENIFDCGFIDVNTDNLADIFGRCTFILLPSSTEAPSSAVLTGMRHGLIPIVMEGIGLDSFNDYCYYFSGFKIEDIDEKIENVLSVPREELVMRSQLMYEYANREFTLENFTDKMSKILANIALMNDGNTGDCIRRSASAAESDRIVHADRRD